MASPDLSGEALCAPSVELRCRGRRADLPLGGWLSHLEDLLQAMGLGGWMFDGIDPFSMMGASGNPAVPGLGFQFETRDDWPYPNVTGKAGLIAAACPPNFPDKDWH